MLKIAGSRKGGVDIEEVPGIVAFIVFIVIFLFAGSAYASLQNSAQKKGIEATLDSVEAEHNLYAFLNKRLGDNRNMADLINEAYLSNDYSALKLESDKFFGEIYGNLGVSYDLVIGGKSLCTKFPEDTIRAVAQVPLMTKNSIEVKLVLEYRE